MGIRIFLSPKGLEEPNANESLPATSSCDAIHFLKHGKHFLRIVSFYVIILQINAEKERSLMYSRRNNLGNHIDAFWAWINKIAEREPEPEGIVRPPKILLHLSIVLAIITFIPAILLPYTGVYVFVFGFAGYVLLYYVYTFGIGFSALLYMTKRDLDTSRCLESKSIFPIMILHLYPLEMT